MTDNRREKRQARELSTELDIKYTTALRLLRTALEAEPNATGLLLRNRCAALLERERAS